MMMEKLYTAAKLSGRKPLAFQAELPDDPVMRKILEGLPSGPDGFRRIMLEEKFPERVRERVREELGADCARGSDAFVIAAEGETITIYAETRCGRLYGAYALIQQADREGIPCGFQYSVPKCSFRGLKLYLPAPDGIEEFKRIIDMACYYRHNTIILEVGGAMEYKRHPEINEGWIEYCREMARHPQRADEIQHMFRWEKNSIHFENGGGQFLSQETVRGLVDYCRDRGLQVIPEVPTLSHSDYLLTRHPELAERACDPFPDSYCPSNPAVYELVFDVLDEILEVFQPNLVHIGHDEYYSYGICERCRKREPADIYAEDIKKIAKYLGDRGIGTMIWPDKLLDVRDKTGQTFGGAERHIFSDNGNRITVMEATWSAIDRIPREIWCHHWYWELREELEQEFLKRGFPVTFGNFSPQKMPHWEDRIAAGVRGGATSSWTFSTEDSLQRDAVLMDLVFGCRLYWGPRFRDEEYTELLPVLFLELFDYKYRDLRKKPHFAITHNTTILRPWVYITSMPVPPSPIGKYVIEYESGKTLEIPLVYGVNITNRDRFWDRSLDRAFDIFQVDNLLIEVSFTTLPQREADGTTSFTFLVEDPYPGEAVREIRVEQIVPAAEGEICLLRMERVFG